MRQRYDRHGLTTLSEINVTPLLDLAFVLLIIFMITAPFLAESADLTIPTTRASRDAVDPASVFVISINRDHEISLDGEPVAYAQLGARIDALRRQMPGVSGKPKIAVVIRPDRDLPVQLVVDVMDILKKVNVTQVGIVTKPGGEL